MDIDWPVVYLNCATAEPLRVFTQQAWTGGLAARYSISHVTAGNHFFVDCAERVFALVGRGMISPGFQLIDLVPACRPDIIGLVLTRAHELWGIDPGCINDIIVFLRQTGGDTK